MGKEIRCFDNSNFEEKWNDFLKNHPNVVKPGESFD